MSCLVYSQNMKKILTTSSGSKLAVKLQCKADRIHRNKLLVSLKTHVSTLNTALHRVRTNSLMCWGNSFSIIDNAPPLPEPPVSFDVNGARECGLSWYYIKHRKKICVHEYMPGYTVHPGEHTYRLHFFLFQRWGGGGGRVVIIEDIPIPFMNTSLDWGNHTIVTVTS